MRAVLRTQLAGVARRPARMLLTGLAVLVASFVVYATVLAQQITERSVLNGLAGTPEAVDLVVRGGVLDAAQLKRISGLPGVAEATGRAEAGLDVDGEYLSLTADPGTGPLSVITLTEGRMPAGPREIAVTPRTVERLGLTVGATAKADAGTGEAVPLEVVGVVTPRDDFGFQGYAPAATVAALTGYDVLDRIDMRLDGGADPAVVRDEVTTVVAGPVADGEEQPEVVIGADVRLDEAQRAASEVTQVFAVVGAFVAVAVIAAGLIAASTFRIVFAQRLRQLALLRAVGAGRSALGRALAAEGILTGLVAGVVGVAGALAVCHAIPPILGAVGFTVSSPGFPLLPALGTVALAVLITLVAVLAPALSAARVAPLEALRSAATTGAKTGIGALRWITGLVFVLLAGGVAAYVAVNLPGPDPEQYDPLPLLLGVIVSGGLAFVALIALGPALVRPVLAVAGWPLRRLGPVGRLAVGGVGGSTRRAAAVSVVVALGVTLIAGVLVGGASVRTLADRELAGSAPADYELTAAEGTPLPAAIVDSARNSADLTRVTPYRRVDAVTVGGLEDVAATDLSLSALPRLADLDASSGSTDDLKAGSVVLGRFVADLAGLAVGDTAVVTAGKGREARLTVVAVLSDMAPLHSGLLVDPADLTALGAPAGASGVLADAARQGEDARTAGLQALRQASAGQPGAGRPGADQSGFRVTVLADQRDQMNAGLTVLLAVALVLIGLTVLIAIVGVGATTALSVVERVRESGLLRAVGMSRGGLRTMLTTESALYGVIGAALGTLLGVPYAWLAVLATGVNAPLALPVLQLAVVFLALVGLTALAGVLPARRAARVSPVSALGTE
ncbi:membrane protein [Actinoplanes sp. OR16]|uniref:FtsX-like permease family protein n=1 Tax=Actinoplanes sp. OR16 TaxID=946334 RepID=UPI000F6E55BA|nr:ABC transporter permease [Actinoplanes sp. OR16]BBH71057.1 membrane protein [Actinoplanes sp. OR16]